LATDVSTTSPIGLEDVESWRDAFEKDAVRRVIMNAIVKNGVDAVAQSRQRVTEMTFAFSHDIATGPMTAQKQSGRCWIFAGLNWVRQRMAKALQFKDLELSQAYLMFFDKLEKANYFLESVVATRREPLDGRLVSWLLDSPLQDGGQWDMFVSLVEKYGVVPKWVMPESFHSSNSRLMNRLVTTKLRQDAMTLRSSQDPANDKRRMMAEIYQLLAEFLGEPPNRFDFEYQDDEGAFHGDYHLSPQSFWERYAGVDLNEYVSVINAPTADKPYGKTFTVDYLGNVVGGHPVLYLNLSMERFKELTLAEVTAGRPVWFGCDVGPMSDRTTGILDPGQYTYDLALGVDLGLTKAQRLDYGESRMTHAMLISGVNVVDGRPQRWKIENSWGEDAGHHGFFVMSDPWFEEYVYQVVVPKAQLNPTEQAALAEPPLHLPPWDPMGSLA
jgi:bleomycin hydrolase